MKMKIVTQEECPSNCLIIFQVEVFQTIRVLSYEPETKYFPFLEKQQHLT